MNKYPNVFNDKCQSKIKVNCPDENMCKLNNYDKLKLQLVNDSSETKKFQLHPYNQSMSNCGYKTPELNNIVSENKIDYKLSSNHTWSNQRGYGNIIVGNLDTCNNIHTRVHPYNRIDRLNYPFQSNC